MRNRLAGALVLMASAATLPVAPLAWAQGDLQDRFREIAGEWGVDATLVIGDQAGASSSRDGRVLIGVARLRPMLEALPGEVRPFAERFLLAHETWHQWQFAHYGPGIMSTPESGQLHECQADVMGAYSAPPKGYPGTPRLAAIDSGLTTFIRSLEEVSYQLGSHPSTAQRLAAAHAGLTRRLLELKLAREPGKDLGPIADLLRDLEVRDDEKVWDWSLRICRGLVHTSWEATRNIDVTGPLVGMAADPHSATRQVVMHYVNQSNRPMRVNVRLTSATESHLEGGAASPIIINSPSVHETFELPPYGRHDVAGELPWREDRDHHTSVRFSPDDPATPLSAEFIAKPAAADCASYSGGNADEQAQVLRRVLTACAATVDKGFSSCRGALLGEDAESRKYSVAHGLPEQIDGVLTLPRLGGRTGSISISGWLEAGRGDAGKAAAHAQFDRYRHALQQLCANAGEAYGERGDDEGRRGAFVFDYRGLDVTLAQVSNPSEDGRGVYYGVRLVVDRINPLLAAPGAGDSKMPSCRARQPADPLAIQLANALQRAAVYAGDGFVDLRRAGSKRSLGQNSMPNFESEIAIPGLSKATLEMGKKSDANLTFVLIWPLVSRGTRGFLASAFAKSSLGFRCWGCAPDGERDARG